jgi:hypothetical protein
MFANWGANSCPAGYARIATVAQCRVAALAFGLSYSRAYTDGDSPKGCFLRNETGDDAVYFNADTTGGLDAASQPLCTTMGTAAPTTAAPVTPSPSFRGPLSGYPDSENSRSQPAPISGIDHHH